MRQTPTCCTPVTSAPEELTACRLLPLNASIVFLSTHTVSQNKLTRRGRIRASALLASFVLMITMMANHVKVPTRRYALPVHPTLAP